MVISLCQQERLRLFVLLSAHQGDAVTAQRLRPFMDQLVDWPEEWDTPCSERRCRIDPSSCQHRVADFHPSDRLMKAIEDIIVSKSKANQLSASLLSLVEKFAPALLSDKGD